MEVQLRTTVASFGPLFEGIIQEVASAAYNLKPVITQLEFTDGVYTYSIVWSESIASKVRDFFFIRRLMRCRARRIGTR